MVTLHQAGRTAAGNPYLLIAYEEGGSLGDRLRGGAVGDWREADARRGIAVAGDDLATVEVDGVPAVLDAALLDAPRTPRDDVLALPGFDEYLLGYKDRTLMLDPAHRQAVVPGGNGVFQSTIVRAGRVVGTWKRTIARARVTVTVRQLTPFDDSMRGRVEAALARYADFLGLPLHHSR
ncbi:winged helix DNA-binding domain-containing protein [Micromonospora sp. 4G55]|nr:winged helix DNA-binding domain-containing protein [Micromonospora sp. 4G55]